jgi:hypothetical protein
MQTTAVLPWLSIVTRIMVEAMTGVGELIKEPKKKTLLISPSRGALYFFSAKRSLLFGLTWGLGSCREASSKRKKGSRYVVLKLSLDQGERPRNLSSFFCLLNLL